MSRYIFSTTARSVTIGVGETVFIDFSGMFLSLNTVSAGGSHSCALISGSAFCWGRGVEGQLGAGAFGILALTPVASASGLVFEGLDAGSNHTCGVTAVGDAYCWGDGGNGRLGDGSSSDSSLPVLVSGGLAFFSVSAGQFHTCGVTDGLGAYCWGSNNNGKLGDGSGSLSSVPVLVSGGLTFASVSAGSQHTCGVTTDGAAYCWGSNSNGKLGDGSGSLSSVPVLVSGGLTFASVSAGSQHTCGVTTAGDVYCWGNNGNGQLGECRTMYSATVTFLGTQTSGIGSQGRAAPTLISLNGIRS